MPLVKRRACHCTSSLYRKRLLICTVMQGSITVTPLPSTARASALGGLPPFAGFLPFGTCCLPALRRLSPLHGLPVLRGLPALRGLSDILPFTCSLPLAGFGPSRARCPCSQILLSFSSNLLLFLQFPSSFRAGFLRFLSLSSGLFLSQNLKSLSSGLLSLLFVFKLIVSLQSL